MVGFCFYVVLISSFTSRAHVNMSVYRQLLTLGPGA